MRLDRNLNHLLKSKKIKLTTLSTKTKIPKQTLHNWLYGADPKNIVQIRSVADFFEITIEELCFGDLEKGIKNKSDDQFTKYHDEINAGIYEVILRKIKSKQ
jgi:hypothetical protein